MNLFESYSRLLFLRDLSFLPGLSPNHRVEILKSPRTLDGGGGTSAGGFWDSAEIKDTLFEYGFEGE